MKAYLTVGLPGSGKSTWAKNFSVNSADTPIIRVNNDDIRLAIYDREGHSNWSPKIEKEVRNLRERLIAARAQAGADVIVDNTHLNPKTLEQMITFCEDLGYIVEIVDFRHVPLETCIERDLQRKGTNGYVGEKVIRDMHRKFMTKAADRDLPQWTPNELPDCIIVDIDGTLAKIKDRGPYDEHKVYQDDVRNHVLFTILSILNANPEVKMFVFSGRSDSCIESTINWLHDKCGIFVENSGRTVSDEFEYSAELHMRMTGDKRRDSFVKMDMWNDFVKDKYNVIAVFDDRPQVIRECWKVLNLPVFNCGLIDVEF